MFLVEADKVAPVKATVMIDGTELQMEVDTGAAVSRQQNHVHQAVATWTPPKGPI